MEFINETFLLKFQSFFEIFMMISIIVVYSLNIYWNLKLLSITEKTNYWWLTHLSTIASFLFVLTFSYLLCGFVIGTPLSLTSYGILFIRPIILFMGSVLAANARATLNLVAKGGRKWILRKSKTSSHG